MFNVKQVVLDIGMSVVLQQLLDYLAKPELLTNEDAKRLWSDLFKAKENYEGGWKMKPQNYDSNKTKLNSASPEVVKEVKKRGRKPKIK